MPTYLTQFAESANGGLFGALGIDWKMLIFQIVGFLILVWVMGKFVYPPLIKVVDKRQEKIEEGAKAAAEAEKRAKKAEAEIEKLLDTAKKDAADIVATAHDEATNTLAQAEQKAKTNAERIVKNAHEQLDKDVAAARRALHNDTVELVAKATEKVVGASVSKSVDTKLIKQSLEDAK